MSRKPDTLPCFGVDRFPMLGDIEIAKWTVLLNFAVPEFCLCEEHYNMTAYPTMTEWWSGLIEDFDLYRITYDDFVPCSKPRCYNNATYWCRLKPVTQLEFIRALKNGE